VTIACCYISPEGIVLGADSTTTYETNGIAHYFNHAQKLFEIGQNSTLGIVTWGLGGLGTTSYRSLIAELDDRLRESPAASVQEVTERWADIFWEKYRSVLADIFKDAELLAAKAPYDKKIVAPNVRTEDEEIRFRLIPQHYYVGFCIAGYVERDRTPAAFAIGFDPTQPKPSPIPLEIGAFFWGAPNLILRLVRGYDMELRQELLNSGKWNGTPAELDTLLDQYAMTHSPTVPIRDAIDFVHSSITCTIKALKFSSLSQICGGPIEIAVVTTDRRFRWVRHKAMDQAITEGEL
jgi:hypothetical protein